MKPIATLITLLLFVAPVWAEEPADETAGRTSTLYMNLQDVLAHQAGERARREASAPDQATGLPPAPPAKSPHKPGWAETAISGIVKGAARQEALNNPDRDLRPQPEPLNRNAFSK